MIGLPSVGKNICAVSREDQQHASSSMEDFDVFCGERQLRLTWHPYVNMHVCVTLFSDEQEVLRSLYPGCPFEREVLGLEMAQLMLSELLPAEEMVASKESETALAKVCSVSLALTLILALSSKWFRLVSCHVSSHDC